MGPLKFPNNSYKNIPCSKKNIIEELQNFINSFKVEKSDFSFINNGLFGFTSYDAVQYFEDVNIIKKENSIKIPEMYYGVYKNIIAINHFKNEAHIFCHSLDDSNNIDEIYQLIKVSNSHNFSFRSLDKIKSNLTNTEQIQLLKFLKI